MTTVTEPGVYELDDATYHADPVPGGSLSSSGARLLLPPNAPAIYKHRLANPVTKSTFDFGHVAHRLVLGKGAEFEVIDADSWRTNAAKAEAAAAREAGKTPLLTKDFEQALAMANAVRNDPIAGALFRHGDAEQSLFWRDRRTSIMRRARIDWLTKSNTGQLIGVDYKTCEHADLDHIQKAIVDYGYHMQAPFYLDGITALNLHEGRRPAFLFVFQEKRPPYLVTVVELDVIALGWGRTLNDEAIDVWNHCRETGQWPGHATDITLIDLPTWVERRYENEYGSPTTTYLETA
jgi:hypothetical protein